VVVPDNRGALITWSAGVSAVAATFAGLLAARATTPLSQNPWFIACLVVACLSFAMLLLGGLVVLASWWQSRESRSAAAMAGPTRPATVTTANRPPLRVQHVVIDSERRIATIAADA